MCDASFIRPSVLRGARSAWLFGQGAAAAVLRHSGEYIKKNQGSLVLPCRDHRVYRYAATSLASRSEMPVTGIADCELNCFGLTMKPIRPSGVCCTAPPI